MTKSGETENVICPCENCTNKTNHEVLCKSFEIGDGEYNYYEAYMVVKCRGCGRKSFLRIFEDRESAYPISDDEWEVPTTIDNYPKFLNGHRSIITVFTVPKLVETIYMESLLAIREDATILAGLGLRGTIEAICNDRNITGRDLEKKNYRFSF